MRTIIKLVTILSCVLFLAGCSSEYAVTHAQSQGTTIQGSTKRIAFGYWTKTLVQSVDNKGIISLASVVDGANYKAPVTPDQPHTFTVLVHFLNGFTKGQYKGRGEIQATLKPGQNYVVAAKVNKADSKDLDIWIQTKDGTRVTPSVVVHCHRISLL